MLPMRYGSPAARASSRGSSAAATPPIIVPWNCRRVIMNRPLSHALALGLAEQPARSEEQQEQQQHERQHVLELGGDQPSAQRLQQPEEQAPRDAAEGVAEPARHRGG